MTDFSLDGRTALVTGASQGIGEAIARRLAGAGARLVLCARSEDKLRALAAELVESGAEALAFPLDLADSAGVEQRLKSLPEDFAAIDILVNNAGVTADNLLLRMDLEAWEKVIRINLTGAYAATRVLARGMVKRRWGRIISLSSVVGLMGNTGQANYAAAKAGLIGFSKSLARELAARNVTVNVIAPGYIATAMTADLPTETRDSLIAAIPVRRMGTVEDVAASVQFLSSEAGSYITGHVLNISGGLYI